MGKVMVVWPSISFQFFHWFLLKFKLGIGLNWFKWKPMKEFEETWLKLSKIVCGSNRPKFGLKYYKLSDDELGSSNLKPTCTLA